MQVNFNNLVSHNLLFNKYLKPISQNNYYFFFLGFSLAVGDFKLILTTIVFILSMIVIYKIEERSLNYYLNLINKVLNFNNQKIIYSVAIAGLLSIFVYICSHLYTELDNPWLSLFIIIQTILSSLGIVFFVRQQKTKNQQKKADSTDIFNQFAKQLNHPSPLHRLWVINQMMSLWQKKELNPMQINQLQEYFILLKKVELEELIIEKIDYSLKLISGVNSQPLNILHKKNLSKQENSIAIMETVNW